MSLSYGKARIHWLNKTKTKSTFENDSNKSNKGQTTSINLQSCNLEQFSAVFFAPCPCHARPSGRGSFCHVHHPLLVDHGRPRRAKREAIKLQIFEHFQVQDEDERRSMAERTGKRSDKMNNKLGGTRERIAAMASTLIASVLLVVMASTLAPSLLLIVVATIIAMASTLIASLLLVVVASTLVASCY